MKNPLIYLVAGGAALAVLGSKKTKTKSSKDIEKDGISEEEQIINQENIKIYFQKPPIYIKDIPGIFKNLPKKVQEYYDPQYPNSTDGAWVYLKPDIAVTAWDLAKYYLYSEPEKYTAKTGAEADVVTKVILKQLTPDIYWGEGVMPYQAFSDFWYVYISVHYLVRIAYAVMNNYNIISLPGKLND